MLYRYEIKNNGNEDILYLYLDFKNEYSKELATDTNQREITRRTKDFIVNNHIQFHGNKVFLIIDGIVVKTVDLRQNLEKAINNPSYSNDNYIVQLKLEDEAVIEITLKDYLLGTISTIYSDNLMDDTLKCISILYRTYAYNMMFLNKQINNNSSFIKYRHISMYKFQWIDFYQERVNRIVNAIEETDCIFLSYQNHYILPFIHICNNGKTFSNAKYPYLSSVSSLWDLACPNSKEIMDFDYKSISKLLGIEINNKSNISISKMNRNNSVIHITLEGKVFSGEEFRNKLSLNSLLFNIILYQKFVRIITFGYGNGMGLSIYGANELAHDGIDYPNILKYYFPKTNLNKYIKELP